MESSKKVVIIYVIVVALFVSISTLLQAQSTKESKYISLQTIDGRTWMILPDGQPFFSHGLNHIEHWGKGKESVRVAKAIKELGFNAYGYGCPDELRNDLPYIESWNDLVPISTHRNKAKFHYRDVFDADVQVDIERQIKEKCLANINNPNLIGYMWTDLPAWRLVNKHKTNWVMFSRELPATAAGKKEYIRFLKQKYKTIKAFNTVYSTGLSSWTELLNYAFADVPDKAAVKADDAAFLVLIAQKYYQILGTATRKYDPNHLIFGDRLTTKPEISVLKEMLPYVDAIAYQPSYRAEFPVAELNKIQKLSQKPIIICDFAIRFKDGDKKVRGGKLYEGQKEAGEVYVNYIKTALNTPYILGSHWCNLIDLTPHGKNGVKQGMFTQGLKERPILHSYIKELNLYLRENVPTK